MEEVWKDIEWHKGTYKISNLGRVYSVQRKKIKNTFIDKGGYVRVQLYHNYTQKRFLVHRLVAEAFIPNFNNYPQVNHIDENKLNNCVDNLEWCTIAYNNSYSHLENNLYRKTGNYPIAVIQYSLSGEEINRYTSYSKAEKETGIDHSGISACCRGKQKTAGGFVWKKL